MGYGLWVMGYGLWAMGYGLWVIGYGLWPIGYGLWVMGYGLWVMGYWLWVDHLQNVLNLKPKNKAASPHQTFKRLCCMGMHELNTLVTPEGSSHHRGCRCCIVVGMLAFCTGDQGSSPGPNMNSKS